MGILESGENYLETIFVLEQKNGTVRSTDVANELGFSKPSISRAMGILKKDGYITIDKAGAIHLTPKGYAAADNIYERHNLLKSCLIRLGVSETVAIKDACRMEHVISQETFERIKEHLAKYK